MLDHPREAARPAGFWIRAVAVVLDALVVVLFRSTLSALGAWLWGPALDDTAGLGFATTTFVLLFTCLYATTLHAHGGQTLGKMLTGIRVLGVEGEPLLPGAALLRYLGYFASIGTLGMGFVMAGLRRDRRALHDLLAGSRVERLAARRGPTASRSPQSRSEDPGVDPDTVPAEPAAPVGPRPAPPATTLAGAGIPHGVTATPVSPEAPTGVVGAGPSAS